MSGHIERESVTVSMSRWEAAQIAGELRHAARALFETCEPDTLAALRRSARTLAEVLDGADPEGMLGFILETLADRFETAAGRRPAPDIRLTPTFRKVVPPVAHVWWDALSGLDDGGAEDGADDLDVDAADGDE